MMKKSKNSDKITMKAILFDLDNTLYDAGEYFAGAFTAVSEYLSKKYNIYQEHIHNELVKLWKEKTSIYSYLFNDLLYAFNIYINEVEIVVKMFNEYDGKLEPYSDAILALRELKRRRYKLGIVTDGNVERQKRKIELLGFKHFFDVVIYAKEMGSKPSSYPYLKALEELETSPSNTFYVADNPLIDFEGAKRVGIRTIRLLRGEFAEFPSHKYIDFEIKKLDELLEIIG